MRVRFIALVAALGAGALMFNSAAIADKPEIDPTYADGQTVYMIGAHAIPDARDTQPNLYAHAEELYLVTYPETFLPSPGNAPPITLPSGYQPQCNPCFHPGLPAPFVYHDHIITGLPGHGTSGTAGAYLAPWKIIILRYNPLWTMNLLFTPLKSADAVDAVEATGNENVLLKFNAGGPNQYEIDTGNVLICPTVSSHA